jgi:hypothetical protein
MVDNRDDHNLRWLYKDASHTPVLFDASVEDDDTYEPTDHIPSLNISTPASPESSRTEPKLGRHNHTLLFLPEPTADLAISFDTHHLSPSALSGPATEWPELPLLTPLQLTKYFSFILYDIAAVSFPTLPYHDTINRVPIAVPTLTIFSSMNLPITPFTVPHLGPLAPNLPLLASAFFSRKLEYLSVSPPGSLEHLIPYILDFGQYFDPTDKNEPVRPQNIAGKWVRGAVMPTELRTVRARSRYGGA